MNGYLPVGIIIILISLYLFYENNRIQRNKRINRQIDRKERNEELLRSIRKNNTRSTEIERSENPEEK